MKKSKLLVFNEDDNEQFINERIETYERKGWEVTDHRVSIARGSSFSSARITVLMQKEEWE